MKTLLTLLLLLGSAHSGQFDSLTAYPVSCSKNWRGRERMRRKWPVLVKDKRLINLGVADEFAYMEGRLVKLLVRRLAKHIGEPRKSL